MKYYILGCNGQLGSLFVSIYPDAQQFSGRIQNKNEVNEFLKDLTENDIVIVTAALTNVNLCEERPDLSFQSNVLGVKYIADNVAKSNATMVFYSSDYVFDGKKGMYSVDDIPNPINVYGLHKLLSENYILSHVEKNHIIRTNMVYGYDKSERNFTSRLLARLRARKKMQVVTDEWVTPTNNIFLVAQTIDLFNALSKKYGIVHIAGSEVTNRYNFACRVADYFHLPETLIEPIKSDQSIVKRPLNGGLKTTHPCGLIHDGIAEMFLSMKESEKEE